MKINIYFIRYWQPSHYIYNLIWCVCVGMSVGIELVGVLKALPWWWRRWLYLILLQFRRCRCHFFTLFERVYRPKISFAFQIFRQQTLLFTSFPFLAFTISSYICSDVAFFSLVSFVLFTPPFLLFGITSWVYAWKSNTSESVSSLSVEVFVCLCVCRFRLHAFYSFTLFQTNGDAHFLHITLVVFGPKHTHSLCFYLDIILFLDVNLLLLCAFFHSFFLLPQTNGTKFFPHRFTNKYSFDALLYVSIVRWKMLIERIKRRKEENKMRKLCMHREYWCVCPCVCVYVVFCWEWNSNAVGTFILFFFSSGNFPYLQLYFQRGERKGERKREREMGRVSDIHLWLRKIKRKYILSVVIYERYWYEVIWYDR